MANQRTVLAYAGALKHDGQLVHAYHAVTAAGVDETAQLYPAPLGDFPPGTICSYEVARDGEVVNGSARYVGVVPDHNLVAGWTVQHNATLASEHAWNAPLKGMDWLKPIRDAYHRLDEERQGQLIAQVVRYIVDKPK